jgi:hypothetical protein
VLKAIGEVERNMGLDGREKGLDGQQKNSIMGEYRIGRMIVHVEVIFSSSLPPWDAEPCKGSEILDILKGGVVEEELTSSEGLLEERSVTEEMGELNGVRAWSMDRSLCPALAFSELLRED